MDKISKKITAAIVIVDDNGNILGCHSYGKKLNTGYDFPKGCVEEGESDLNTAIRELQEETGICFSDFDISKIIDAGVYKHNSEKNIHLFIYKTNQFPPIEQLKCTSYFERNGKQFPEMDGYKIISINERNMFNKVLQDKFEIIDKYIIKQY